jgi:hypothetical protein
MASISFPPLLVHTAVFPKAPYLQMQNHERRISETIRALKEWYRLIPNLRLVIVDGSDFDWSSKMAEFFPGKEVECLSHVNDRDMVERFGGGYGESETLNFAIANSLILKKYPTFMKCTGKYWVDNIHSISKKDLMGPFKCKAVFKIMDWKLLYINTIFYVANVDQYVEHFTETYKYINDHNGNDIEHVMAQLILKNEITGYQLGFTPKIRGWSGHIDQQLAVDKSIRSFIRAAKYKFLSYIL